MKQSIQKMLEILSRDELKQEDLNELEFLFSSDRDAKDFFKKFRRLEDMIKATSHISEDDLSEYILSKNNNSAYGSDATKFKFFEEHLKNCVKCSSDYLELSEEYSNIENYLSENLLKPEGGDKSKDSLNSEIFKYKAIRYSLIFVAAVVLLFFSLTIVSQLTTPQNIKLAQTEDSPLYYVTRGRASDEFQKGLLALDDNKFDKAINHFQNDLGNNKNDETIFYTNYILGFTYLEKSEKDFIGLFKSYDFNNVNKAIDNFKECITKNKSGNFPDITANSYFFLAKADLLLNNSVQAKKNLQKVIDLKGSRTDQAKELLNNLE